MLMRGLSRRRCFINNRFMITAKNISAETNVRHAFFTRQGGVSDGIYGSLNCGPGSSDKRDNVIDNRARAMACLDQEPEALVTAYQYHSAEVVMVDEAWALGDSPKGGRHGHEPEGHSPWYTDGRLCARFILGRRRVCDWRGACWLEGRAGGASSMQRLV